MLVYPDAREFAYIIESATILNDDVELIIKNNLRIRALDRYKIALVDITIPRDFFERFDASNTQVVINLADLTKIFKYIRRGEKIELSVDENVKINIVGRTNRSLIIPRIVTQENDITIPDMKFTAELRMLSEDLENILRDSKVISNEVMLTAVKNTLTITARGISIYEAKPKLHYVSITEPTVARYDADYLLNMVAKGSKLSETVKLEFSSNMPLRMTFNSNVKIIYYLAHRI